MNNLNSILLEGVLNGEPELSYTRSGSSVCKFQIESRRFYKKDDEEHLETCSFDIVVWSRLAEVCSEYLNKGRGVRIVGRLKQERWSDLEGKARSKVIIVAEHVEFKPVKKEAEPLNEVDSEGAPKDLKTDLVEVQPELIDEEKTLPGDVEVTSKD